MTNRFLHKQNKLPNKFVIDTDSFHRFTMKQRFQIAIGYNVIVRFVIAINKRDESSKVHFALKTTNLGSAEDVIKNQQAADMTLAPEDLQ